MQRTEKQREKTLTTEGVEGAEAAGVETDLDLGHADGHAPGIDTGKGQAPETSHVTEDGPGQDPGQTKVDPTAGRDHNFAEAETKDVLPNPLFTKTIPVFNAF